MRQPERCIAPLVGYKSSNKVAKGTNQESKQQSVPSPDLVREHPEDEASRQQADHKERVDRWGPDVLAAVLRNIRGWPEIFTTSYQVILSCNR